MIILSFNVRGVGGALKQQALKRLFTVYKPYVFLLRETLCSESKAIEILSSIAETYPDINQAKAKGKKTTIFLALFTSLELRNKQQGTS